MIQHLNSKVYELGAVLKIASPAPQYQGRLVPGLEQLHLESVYSWGPTSSPPY